MCVSVLKENLVWDSALRQSAPNPNHFERLVRLKFKKCCAFEISIPLEVPRSV